MIRAVAAKQGNSISWKVTESEGLLGFVLSLLKLIRNTIYMSHLHLRENSQSEQDLDMYEPRANIDLPLMPVYHKDSEVNLSAFIDKLFHEDFSSIVETNTILYTMLYNTKLYLF